MGPEEGVLELPTPGEPRKVIQDIVPNGIWSQGPIWLTVPTQNIHKLIQSTVNIDKTMAYI